jgi:integrase
MKVDGLKGSIYQRGGVWWVKYHQHGRVLRESTKSAKQGDAEKLLLKRNAAIEEGRTINLRVNRCKVDALLEMVVTDYKVNRKKSLPETERRIRKHLKPFFGGRLAISIESDLIVKFIEKRQAAGAANGEINRELAVLRRGYTLGRKAKRVDDAPCIEELEENSTRKGFFERAEFETVVSHLSPELRAVLRFAYVTGWRVNSEVLTLEWRHVDWTHRTVRLEMGETKNAEGRVFKFTSELEEVLRAQDAATRAVQRTEGRICPWVFHRNGRQIKDYYTAWRNACLAAGLGQRDPKTKRIKTSRIPHDFRRTAVRNLVNAGVPEKVAMQMTGHKTRSVFDHYHIVSPGDVERAAALLDAKLTADRAQHASGHNLGTVAVLRDPVDFAVARK